jgi:hypothetical protein
VSKKAEYAKLAETKLALARKYERLVKSCKSRPRQQTYRNQIEKFRRQAEQLSRM